MKNRKIILVFSILIVLVFTILMVFSINNQNAKKITSVAQSNSNTIKVEDTKEEYSKPKAVVYDLEQYKENRPTYYSHAVYVHETNTPEKAAGVASYVFIGKVNDIVRTEYRFPTESVVDGKIVTVTEPYTVYSVSVIENIKGNLVTTRDIEVIQNGGLHEDMKNYSFMPGMGYLEVGKYYILLPYASLNGNVGINQQTSVIPLELSDEDIDKTIKEAKDYANKIINNEVNLENRKLGTTQMEIIAEYILAVKNQIIPDDVKEIKSKLYDEEYAK